MATKSKNYSFEMSDINSEFLSIKGGQSLVIKRIYIIYGFYMALTEMPQTTILTLYLHHYFKELNFVVYFPCSVNLFVN